MAKGKGKTVVDDPENENPQNPDKNEEILGVNLDQHGKGKTGPNRLMVKENGAKSIHGQGKTGSN